MRIVSANVNGIRACARKGFFDWMQQASPDVICMQEIKAQEDQLNDPVFSPDGWHRFLFPAERKGYSGVAIYTRMEPAAVRAGLGFDLADKEGRYLQIDLAQCSIGSLYLPSGSSKEERQLEKYRFMDQLETIMADMQASDREFILCGDWNIVHKEIDIRNFKSNQKNSGCLPEERAWLDRVFGDWQWTDAFRVLNQEPEQYTWWSNRGQAWARNVGWRIDYQVITPGLRDRVKQVDIYKDERFSDHAPLIIDYDL